MVGNGSSHQTPGRPSPAVYRRRRIVAGVLALLVVIGIVTGIVTVVNALRGDGAAASDSTAAESAAPVPAGTEPGTEKTPAATPAPSATPSKSAKPKETASAAALCPAASVGVSATTDALSYSSQVSPVLTLTVTNTGTEPCQVNLGTSQMEFIVTSGPDRIFSSADCQQPGEDLLKTVKPNSVETAKFTWDRQRSTEGCTDVSSKPGPGTYAFTARLGEISSERTTFELE
ncbi:hypothetical protein ACIQXM_07465 [Arthrobacter sp. NPDC097144]|uniref:hypothetical protein n=1 Tax=Arthrobacter sp. NPDC097144 TaxID=3363946 RepID=UPI0037F11EBC